ncbi:TRAP transporter substrate-binding protein [Pseudomonas sp. GD03721]|nr:MULTISPECIES: TRAP transporter substrate-binding protein [unclassified Pseudomonas]MDH1443264.1 TRAP transporter substrate-binding protein [Pseudomonas sp. GD03722]WGG00686.1 TRAP transporter substrate-binding protein [Pseudomonas sp. GD03721]WGG04852.1 TRAP transporter substrate-binding protein [Pseudomonas sp. GD03919]
MRILKTLTVLGVCLAAPLSQAAESVILRVAHFLPSTSNAHRNVIQPWCDTLARESEQRITCQIYPSMQLGGTPAQLADQVLKGVADVVWTAPGYSTGRFPRSETVELPFMLPAKGELGSKIIWEFYEAALQEDFKNYKVLALHSDGGMQLHTTRLPVTTLESFKGVKLRASTRMTARLLDSLGGTPVSMPPAQLTEALSKGVVDGALVGWEVLPALKLDEVTRFHAEPEEGQPIFSTTLLGMLMNQKRYQNLPDDLRAVIDRNSGLALSMSMGANWEREAIKARERVRGQGATVTQIEPAEYQRMREAGQELTRSWVEEAQGKGIDGTQLAETLRTIAQANGLQY